MNNSITGPEAALSLVDVYNLNLCSERERKWIVCEVLAAPPPPHLPLLKSYAIVTRKLSLFHIPLFECWKILLLDFSWLKVCFDLCKWYRVGLKSSSACDDGFFSSSV